MGLFPTVLDGDEAMFANEYEAVLTTAGPAWRREAQRVIARAQRQDVHLNYETLMSYDVRDLQRLSSRLQEDSKHAK